MSPIISRGNSRPDFCEFPVLGLFLPCETFETFGPIISRGNSRPDLCEFSTRRSKSSLSGLVRFSRLASGTWRCFPKSSLGLVKFRIWLLEHLPFSVEHHSVMVSGGLFASFNSCSSVTTKR